MPKSGNITIGSIAVTGSGSASVDQYAIITITPPHARAAALPSSPCAVEPALSSHGDANSGASHSTCVRHAQVCGSGAL